MKVGYIFNDERKEKRIVGGADIKQSDKDLSWLDFTEKEILIKEMTKIYYLK
jgi:hypothetical protein